MHQRPRMTEPRMPRSVASSALLSACLLLAGGACSDSTEPGDSVPGTYAAVSFSVTDGGVTVDVLQLGGSAELVLEEDGITAGRLFVPGGDEDGSDLDMDLVGTWTLEEDMVLLHHEADTFLRDVALAIVAGGRLVGDYVRDETQERVQITFLRES